MQLSNLYFTTTQQMRMLSRDLKSVILILKSTSTSSQLQTGRPPGHRDVEFDKFGNVISMAKVDLNLNQNRR